MLISKAIFQNKDGQHLNAIRMGFASLNESELINGVKLLKQSVLATISEEG